MNGDDKSSVKIDVSLSPNAVLPEFVKRSVSKGRFSPQKWIREVWEFSKEDTNRVTFSLKVGLSMLLVSLLILMTAPFEHFGTNIVWSILTVGIMFEYTVGATLNRGFNRAVGSLIAGIFAIVVILIALSSGDVASPYVVGLSIFLVGTITSFMKLWPSLVPYEYGFRVLLFTYCLIIVSVYRIDDPMKTGMERLYSIAIGAVIAVLVNLLVFPIWAGEQLHKELVGSFYTIADSLEECVKKYLSDSGSDLKEFSEMVTDDFPDEPAFKKCRGILNSSARFDSLASSAKWEPPHGKFPHFFYPWSQYVRVGAVLRHCAYEVMALHGCHENMRKQQRRLHSWPSREVDELEEDGGIDTGMIPKMCTLESIAALSVATFTSLLIEFVARLDHLVDAVDEQEQVIFYLHTNFHKLSDSRKFHLHCIYLYEAMQILVQCALIRFINMNI